MNKPVVSVVMGSQSDLEIVQEALTILENLGIDYEAKILSAHRTPEALKEYVADAVKRGLKVFIAAAGGAAALAGVIASHTTLPVIGIPIETKTFGGLDSLLSTVQMPAGVPVACMAIGKAGARNAAFFAAEILGIAQKTVAEKLKRYRKETADTIKKIRIPAHARNKNT